MQKKLIALAVAGLVAAPAMAQSNVTIYGVADAYFGFGSDNNNDISAIDSGGLAGSRIGFKGSEDLGNGLKAVFTLEQGYAIDTGKASPSVGDSVFSRQAWVGLQGSFGTVSLGRQYAPGYFVADYDALLSSKISPQSTLSDLNRMTITPNSLARWDNSVKYTGSFDAVNVQAIYSMGTNEALASGVSDDDKYGLSAAYANGPVNVGVIYHNVGYASKDQSEWLIGASYDFGMAKVAGSYQAASNIRGTANADSKLWNLGVIVPVGGGNVHLAYAKLDEDGTSVDPFSYTLAYTYPFSKRTTAYAGYQKLDYDTATKDDRDLFVVGLNHKF
ncbi:porin [Hydrogenophilus thermoluteolus]|nr:porin [Hydrogenophilus thermoluteolus]MBW7656140.1 porin [Hydrogenophilus thermoluteolus]